MKKAELIDWYKKIPSKYLTKTHNNYSASYAFPLKLKNKKATPNTPELNNENPS